MVVTSVRLRLFPANLKAGGVGLTLTRASNVGFWELGWNPSTHDQAEDRCARIGQRNAVTCFYFMARASIDWTSTLSAPASFACSRRRTRTCGN